MTHRIDSARNWVEPSNFDSMIDGTLAHPKPQELAPCHHPVLLLGESRYRLIDSPSPSQTTYIGV